MTPDNISDQADAVATLEEFQAAQETKIVQAFEKQMGLRDVLHRYDIVEAKWDPLERDSYIVVSERSSNNDTMKFTETSGFSEMAILDPSPFTAWTRLENQPELRDKKGLRKYYDMVRNDGTVRSALRIVKTPIQGAEWYIEPYSDSTVDKNIADFVQKTLFEDMETMWEHFIEDSLRCMDYGFFAFEKVWYPDPKTSKIKVNLSPLHPLDIQGWIYDGNNRVTGLAMEPLAGTDITKRIEIPKSKVLLQVFEMEGGDLRGTSLLRTAYKHWYYKDTMYKIDAIQKERHGIGVPIIKLPMGFTPRDRELANDLGRNLRTNEKAYITVPFNWEVMFAKLEGQPVNPIPSIDHHDHKIYEAILASFMGSGEVSTESLDTFYKSTRYMANIVAATINRDIVRQLVDINFLRFGGYPKLCVRRMGEWEDTRTMTFALRNLVGARILTPDLPLENIIRSSMSLPPLDESTAREMPTPGAGGLASPTSSVKPSPAKGSRQQATPYINTPATNAGSDKTGGK